MRHVIVLPFALMIAMASSPSHGQAELPPVVRRSHVVDFIAGSSFEPGCEDAPFAVVIMASDLIFMDGFESGDTSEWSTSDPCGNGALDLYEMCDGSNLGAESCETQGYDGGELACFPDCTAFDFDGCYVCNDNQIGGNEVCDGEDLGGETCQSQGYDGGTLACRPDCLSFDFSACVINP